MYRFAFDLGTNSLGWAVYALSEDRQPTELARLGARIFPNGRDPQSKESNAVGRRGPRGARRNHDRSLGRRKRLLDELITCGLLPADAEILRRETVENLIFLFSRHSSLPRKCDCARKARTCQAAVPFTSFSD